MKIYTKTGDRGDTGLLGPLRVGKDHPRISAYGSVDELNAAVGMARALAPRGTGRGGKAPAAPRAAAGSRAPAAKGKRAGATASGRKHAGGPRGAAAWDAAGPSLPGVQDDLFVLGAMLATPPDTRPVVPPLAGERVARLESAIDAAVAELPPLATFVQPAGSPLAAQLHVARTVCRRAERDVVALSRTESVDPVAIVYLNRLSDLLFTLARAANAAAGVAETPWPPETKTGRR